MPRKLLIKSNCLPYHVFNRTNDREFYSISMDKVFEIFEDYLRLITWAFGARIHAFVLMSNHYHLLLSTPESNLDDIMEFFQSNISRQIQRISGTKKFRFESRYKWCIIKDPTHFKTIYRYLYQNPVRAGLCRSVADYKFSTISGLMGNSTLGVPISPHSDFSGVLPDFEHELDWLDINLDEKELKLTQKGLRRRIFSYPKK